jgi:rhodanese-related sulfurtransferase
MATSIPVEMLYSQLGLPDGPSVLDVRQEEDFAAQPRMIPGALRVPCERLQTARSALPRRRRIVVYCAKGKEVARNAADELIGAGYPVSYLEGGLAAWLHAAHATIRVRPEFKVPGGSRWVTRERPKIDRLACPWLVRRFIDPQASFYYTPPHRVRAQAEALEAEPYDIADVTFSHRGPRCSFDAFLDEFELHDPTLDQLAGVVRAADTATLEQSREAAGLLAISLGLSANIPDDLVLLEQAMPVYDALYAWCKKAQGETHSWPTQPRA